jgi:thiamine phosphate synthase YjbQ (UPF0047 family)
MTNNLSYLFRIPITDGRLNMGTWQVLVFAYKLNDCKNSQALILFGDEIKALKWL